MRADDVRVVWVRLREELVEHRLFDNAIRLVLDALAALVPNDVLLVGQVRLIDLVEQVPHAIRLQP